MFTRSLPTPLFPIYLLPSIPFRRHRTPSSSSTDSSTSSTSPTTPPYLTTHTSHLRCATCSTDICLTSQIISKGFTGRHGRAYLVAPTPTPSSSPSLNRNLPNTLTDPPSSRQLVTGVHTVADDAFAWFWRRGFGDDARY
ncbi:hypothetical protein JMJ35_002188 [Cladonia borealis]|uniref:Uncharacterized protein n=1 Tax=Cladonia borealis TaxID=184061 RepID=A0AA39R6V2_9LECA|nr:hypothetical protein JMJ35_002188 [Cladonia borealis]